MRVRVAAFAIKTFIGAFYLSKPPLHLLPTPRSIRPTAPASETCLRSSSDRSSNGLARRGVALPEDGHGVKQLASPIGATEIVNARLQSAGVEAGSPEYVAAMAPEHKIAVGQAELLREREAAAQSLPVTLRVLEQKNVRGRDWLEQARNETEMPVLMLDER